MQEPTRHSPKSRTVSPNLGGKPRTLSFFENALYNPVHSTIYVIFMIMMTITVIEIHMITSLCS